MKAEPKRHHYSRVEKIEQAIARGDTLDVICRNLRCSPREIDAAMKRMDDAIATVDAAADIIQRTAVVAIRKAPPAGARTPAVTRLTDHGTHSAFNRHRYWREAPCSRCVDGERAYQAARARAHRARAKGAA